MNTRRAVLSDDTAPSVEAALVEHWRHQPPAARYETLVGDVRTVRFMMRAGARLRRPYASDAELDRAVARTWLGADLEAPTAFTTPNREAIPMDDPDPYAVAASVSEAFDALGIPHVVVGSLASIAFGEPRLTRDGDLVADVKIGQVAALAVALVPDFFVDGESVRDAVLAKRSFNIFHRATMFKVDVFPCTNAFNRSGIQRAIHVERGGRSLPVATPEDCLVAKLRWYRLGNEVSDQQWRDILGILMVQGDALDESYLDHWADDLGVADLLARAREAVAGA